MKTILSKRNSIYFAICVLAVLSVSVISTNAQLVPKPQQVNYGEGVVNLPKTTGVYVTDSSFKPV